MHGFPQESQPGTKSSPSEQDTSGEPDRGIQSTEQNGSDGESISVNIDSNDPENYNDDDSGNEDNYDSREEDDRDQNIVRRRNKESEAFAKETDQIDELLLHDMAKAQREAFLFFLISCSYEGESKAPPKDPLTVYFSVFFQMVSPFGLLGNLASLISICDHWRKTATGQTVSDEWWVLFLNSLALACGCFGNIILFLHAERWMRRFWSLIAVCILYFVATLIYLALLGVTQVVYFRWGRWKHLNRTSGYWHAVCAASLYFFSSIVLMANLIYFHNRKWNAALSHRQRRIMALCSGYIAWIAIGGGAFQPHTMLNVSYADAAYFCVVSTLTLGYGDITPPKTLPRALVIPYIYTGLVLGGLSTLAIFQASFTSARHESIATHVEQRRRKALTAPKKSEEQNFEAMREILRVSRSRALMSRAVVTTTWLLIFWLIGALIFKYTEGWTYFEAFYYVAVSLATVGFGDFTPKSPGGRSFFTYWALLAVPTMTTAVSDLSAVVMQWMKVVRMLEENGRLFGLTQAYRWYRDKHVLQDVEEDEEGDALKAHITKMGEDLPNQKQWHNISRIAALPSQTTFSFETWHKTVCRILGVEDLPSDFWISEMSPIRKAGCNERQFMLLTALNMLRLSMPETESERSAKEQSSMSSPSSSTVAGSAKKRQSKDASNDVLKEALNDPDTSKLA